MNNTIRICVAGSRSKSPHPGGWAWAYKKDDKHITGQDTISAPSTAAHATLVAVLQGLGKHEDVDVEVTLCSYPKAVDWLTKKRVPKNDTYKRLLERIDWLVEMNNLTVTYVTTISPSMEETGIIAQGLAYCI